MAASDVCAHRLFDGPLCCTNAEPLPHTHTYGATEPGDTHYEPSESEH